MPDRGRVLNEKSKAMRGGLRGSPRGIDSDRLAAPPPSKPSFDSRFLAVCGSSTPGHSSSILRREVGAEIKKLRPARSIAGFDRVDTSLCANLTEGVEIHPHEPETGCRLPASDSKYNSAGSDRSGRPRRSRPRRHNRGECDSLTLLPMRLAPPLRRRVDNLAIMPGGRAER